MQIINLKNVGKEKRKVLIRDYCGGNYSSREAVSLGGIGIGGLRYLDGLSFVDEKKKADFYACNFELMRSGIVIYLRQEDDNFLILLQDDEVVKITYAKPIDELIERNRFSLFKKALGLGMSYHYAKLLLHEDEISILHPAELMIYTKEDQVLKFHFAKKRLDKLAQFFDNSKYCPLFYKDVQSYRYL